MVATVTETGRRKRGSGAYPQSLFDTVHTHASSFTSSSHRGVGNILIYSKRSLFDGFCDTLETFQCGAIVIPNHSPERGREEVEWWQGNEGRGGRRKEGSDTCCKYSHLCMYMFTQIYKCTLFINIHVCACIHTHTHTHTHTTHTHTHTHTHAHTHAHTRTHTTHHIHTHSHTHAHAHTHAHTHTHTHAGLLTSVWCCT